MKTLVVLLLVVSQVGFALAQTLEETNERVVRSEAPIVAGNAVSAKKRALADAFRQAAERAYTELLTQNSIVNETPRLQQLKSSFASSGQKYIRRYRILEEEEAQGKFLLMVEAEVDTVLLRREIEKSNDDQGAIRGSQATFSGAPLLVGGKLATALIQRLITDLATANVKAAFHPAKDERALLIASAKANAPALFLKMESTNEGKVRGGSQVSIACQVDYRLFTSAGLKNSAAEMGRGFAMDEPTARNACFEHLIPQISRGVSESLRSTFSRTPYITLNLDVIEPAVLTHFTAALKRLGAVMASEVRLVTSARIEIRVFTRVAGATLQSLLLRELSSKLTITPVRIEPNQLTLQIRMPQQSELVTPEGNVP
jgi:hypothetical protein